MDPRELVWRTGGTGGGAPDGGRDLEATFYRPTPDGEIESEKWWVGAKGRTGTVEPDAVKSAVINANEKRDLDLLVFATNSQFSNPTRELVRDWAANHLRPKVKLWDRRDLLRLIRAHPILAARTVPDMLPDNKRINMLAAQFYEIGKSPSHKDLEYFWGKRESITESEQIATFTYGELLYGDLTHRPWGIQISAKAFVMRL